MAFYRNIERFRNGDAITVYRRSKEQGRLVPESLKDVSSRVDPACTVCYQVMRTHDRAPLVRRMANRSDIVHFEVIPVITSVEAAAIMVPKP